MACARLQHLDLAHNQLTALPHDWSQLRGLRTLQVHHNRLTSLPASLAACTSLLELYAGEPVVTRGYE